MLGLVKYFRKNKQLDSVIASIEMNMSNNYKDAAQEDYRALLELYRELTESGTLSDKQKDYYKGILEEYSVKMENYTHKDQKPYWV